MKIPVYKFGTLLTSRHAGREAWAAFQPRLSELRADELIELDFKGVDVLTPSWADEFVTPLQKTYPHRVELQNTDNASVQETLSLLEDIDAGALNFD